MYLVVLLILMLLLIPFVLVIPCLLDDLVGRLILLIPLLLADHLFLVLRRLRVRQLDLLGHVSSQFLRLHKTKRRQFQR